MEEKIKKWWASFTWMQILYIYLYSYSYWLPHFNISGTKGDVGMAKHFFLKVRKQGMTYQLSCTCNPNKSYVKIPDTSWYVPTLLPPEPSSIFYYLELKNIGDLEACIQPCGRGFVMYMLFLMHGCIVIHMQVFGTPSLTLLDFTTQSILVLASCSWGSDVGI